MSLKQKKYWKIWPGSLRFRLVLVVVLAVLPLAGARLWAHSVERDEILLKANQSAARIARTGALAVRDSVQEARNTLEILSAIPVLRDASDAGCPMQLSAIAASRPWATGFYILDAGGTIICASDMQAVGLNISDRAYVKTAIGDREFFAGDFIIGRKTGVPMIGSALPIFDRRGELRRVFVATIATKWFDHVALDLVAANPGSTATLLDGEGIVLSDAPAGGNVVGAPLVSQTMTDALQSGGGQNFTAIGDDGINRIFGVASMPYSRARLLIGLSKENVLAELARRAGQTMLELTTLCLLLGLAIWALCLRAIAQPINTLLLHARSVADGKLDARILWQGWPGELASLAQSLNLMTARLDRRKRQLESAQRQLKRQSMTDHLTGIANRRGFDAQLSALWPQAMQQGTGIALCMIDADHFKLYNDSHGHAAGDDVLGTIGQILKQAAAASGGYAARLGGEEFALLLPGRTETQALVMAEEICRNIRAAGIPHEASSLGIVTASIGVAHIYPGEAAGIPQLLEAADAAMYAAKASGRNAAFASQHLARLASPRPRPDGAGRSADRRKALPGAI